MNRHINACIGAGMLLVLAACGSSNNNVPAPEVKVTELAAGVYAVATGDASTPEAGKYYAASDGSRLLVLNNSSAQASALYRREGNGSWQMTPTAKQNTTLDLLNSSAVPSTVLNVTSVARSYMVRLSSGTAAAFTISSAGDIVAGATTCKLTGKLSTSTLPNTLKASLTASSCGDLPAQSEGYLVADSDYAPATFRLLTSSGSTLVDLWAYAE